MKNENTRNNLTTSIVSVKDALETNETGVTTLTIDGVTTKSNEVFNDKIIPTNIDKFTMLNDKAGTVLKRHFSNLKRYVNNVRVNLIYTGKELAEIRADKSYKDIANTFDNFLKMLGIAKATAYHYISAYIMVCDVFGNINEKALATGDITVFKAERIGITSSDFVQLAEKCAAEEKPLTPENLIEQAKAHNIKLDPDKVSKEIKKSKKTVTVLPEVETGYIRFIHTKNDYIDIPDSSIKNSTTLISAITNKLGEGWKGFYNKYDFGSDIAHYVTVIKATEVPRVYFYMYHRTEAEKQEILKKSIEASFVK